MFNPQCLTKGQIPKLMPMFQMFMDKLQSGLMHRCLANKVCFVDDGCVAHHDEDPLLISGPEVKSSATVIFVNIRGFLFASLTVFLILKSFNHTRLVSNRICVLVLCNDWKYSCSRHCDARGNSSRAFTIKMSITCLFVELQTYDENYSYLEVKIT